MSINQFPGGIVTKNPTAPTTASAKGIWTLSQATSYAKQGIWPRIPGAPTIGTATAGASTCASVTFTAPTCVGAGALTYSVISTPGCISNTGASSPIVVSGLTGGTSYTFKVYGVTPGGTGPGSAASNSITAVVPSNSQSYTTAGTYSWVAPAGVTSVSVVAIGGGGSGQRRCCGTGGRGGGGGGLGYKNNISVTPGNSYTVVVGAGGVSSLSVTATSDGGDSYFCSTSVVKGGKGSGGQRTNGGGCFPGGAGGTYTGTGGGCGGRGVSNASDQAGSGGGAGGYSGNGGNAVYGTNGNSGSGGGGGGGGFGGYTSCGRGAGGGGGVGILGSGSNGAGGTSYRGGGGGGSGGTSGSAGAANGGAGGSYGGGGGGQGGFQGTTGGAGGVGAVRIMWPGNTRSFPSTCAGNP